MFIYECFERIQEEQQWRHHIRLRDEQQQQMTDKGTCTSTVLPQPQQPQSDSTINNSASETFDKSNEEKNGEEIEEEENVNQSSVSNGQAET